MDVDEAKEGPLKGEWKLSAQLAGMNEPVRAVSCVGDDLIVSAGTKGGLMAWRRSAAAGGDARTFRGEKIFQNPLHPMIFCLARLPPALGYPEGAFLSGGTDHL